jgi:hypothetical protein
MDAIEPAPQVAAEADPAERDREVVALKQPPGGRFLFSRWNDGNGIETRVEVGGPEFRLKPRRAAVTVTLQQGAKPTWW